MGRSVPEIRLGRHYHLVFVTGRGEAGFHSQGLPFTRGRGGYFSGNPRPAPALGPAALIPWTGPRLLPPTFNRDPSGVWVGWGPERGQGQAMPKKTPRPRQLSGAGREKGQGPAFSGARPPSNELYYHCHRTRLRRSWARKAGTRLGKD